MSLALIDMALSIVGAKSLNAYWYRATTYTKKGDWETAIADYNHPFETKGAGRPTYCSPIRLLFLGLPCLHQF